MSAGEVEIVYHNESSEVIWFDFARLDEGRTTQDIIDYIEDGTFDAPSWTVQVWNQGRISANASSIPTMRTVAPGLHALVHMERAEEDAIDGRPGAIVGRLVWRVFLELQVECGARRYEWT